MMDPMDPFGSTPLQPEILPAERVPALGPARMGDSARISAQGRINRIAQIAELTDVAARAVGGLYGRASEQTDAAVRSLERQDSLMARLGEEAEREHRIAKDNLRRRQQQLVEHAAATVVAVFHRDLEDLLAQPNAAFYAPSVAERLKAVLLDDTSIELVRRDLPRLTPGEQLRQLLIGGVVDAKAVQHDERQRAERREALDLVKRLDAAQAQLARLAARNADLEQPAMDRDVDVDAPNNAGLVAVVEELLRGDRSRREEPAPTPVPRRRGRSPETLEMVDAEPIN